MILREMFPRQQFPISDKTDSVVPAQDSKPQPSTGADSGGVGIVNWLFDHVKDREPIFLSLFDRYDSKMNIRMYHPRMSKHLIRLCIFADVLIFTIYAVAAVLVILAITYIFLKGTGLLEFMQLEPKQQVPVVEVHIDKTTVDQ